MYFDFDFAKQMFTLISLLPHAVHGALGEHFFHAVVIRFERSRHRGYLLAIGGVRRCAQAHVLEDFLHLTLRECITATELLSQ